MVAVSSETGLEAGIRVSSVMAKCALYSRVESAHTLLVAFVNGERDPWR